MRIALATLFSFAFLTLWVPAVWPVAIFEIGVFALAAVMTCRSVDRPVPFAWPAAPFAFAIGWGVLQWLTGRTAYAFVTKNAIVQWVTLLCVFLIALAICRDKSASSWVRGFMVWFAAVIATVGVLQHLTSSGRVFGIFPVENAEFALGPFLSRNEYAAFIEVVLPMVLAKTLAVERSSVLYASMAAWMYASVIGAASRAGTVLVTAEIVSVVALLWIRGRLRHRNALFAVAAIAALCAMFVIVVGPDAVWARFRLADLLVQRREFALSSLKMIAQHPWFGVGLGAWPTVYPAYAVADFGVFANQAHSDWLQWTAEGGIPLGVVLASLFFWSLRRAIRSVWGLGVVAVLLHAGVDYPFARPALGSWVVLVMAMMAARSLRAPKVSNC